MECATFTYRFDSKSNAERAANIIRDWAESNLDASEWVKQLFPVKNDILFVGNNAAIKWLDFDGKINRLPDIILAEMPDVKFMGEQNFTNLNTGFETIEEFECADGTVTYKLVRRCTSCGATIAVDACRELEDMAFCDDECMRSWLIGELSEMGDFDEDMLESMEEDELLEMWKENVEG